ncbi:hypothetical protein GW17_00027305 [Ensete ventricosum]|nr:hypothetical protein GW17_00027305 [Ensete ventricosum]
MYVHKLKDTDKHEHFIKHLVYILTVTFSPTYSFDVIVEAAVDVASPYIFAKSSIFYFSCNSPLCFNSPMTESGVGLAELC